MRFALRTKKFLAGTAVLASIALAVTGCGSGSQAAAEQPTLKVATDTAFVPFEFKEGDSYVGFDIDLWTEVAGEMGRKFELQPMDFNGILPALQTKQVDVGLAGVTITEERKKAIDFSNGYYDSGFMLMVPAESNITGVGDLAGKTVAMKTGTSANEWAKKNLPQTELRLFPNIDNAYLELQSGRVDAAMHDTPNVLYYIKQNGGGKVKAVGEQQMAQQYGMAFPKGSELVPQVNDALAKIKADGRYDKIYEKWFGKAPSK